ncbi:Tat-linked quality control protein TatD [uncultured archaeon]|nr:Tat-linked quality control protein TatD [uncultured archaeon]
MLVDAHCHLHEIKKYDLTQVTPVGCGYSHASNVKTAELAHKLGLPFALGIAPQSVIKIPDLEPLDGWIDFIRTQKPNAIGEVGLDFHWAKEKQEIEREELTFYRMVDLAEEMKLPLVIHARKATADVLDTLKLRNFSQRVMFHFFSGTVGEAEYIAKQGWLVSITPLHSKERREAIKMLPLESLVVETDAPYVVRTPEEVKLSVEYIAEVKQLDFNIVAEQTANNARKFFSF